MTTDMISKIYKLYYIIFFIQLKDAGLIVSSCSRFMTVEVASSGLARAVSIPGLLLKTPQSHELC